MAERATFVRRPLEGNAEIVVSHCAKCRAFVGAAPSYPLLKLVEDLHACAGTASKKEPKAEKGNAGAALLPRRKRKRS